VLRAQPAGRPAESAVGVEPLGAVEGEARAGRQVVAVEPQAAAELGAEPPGAVEEEARAGPRAESAVEVELSGAEAVVAPRALGGPQAVAPARVASPSGVQWSVEGCHSIRRICFLEERTCGTSGTLPGGRPVRLGRVELARTALRAPVASPRVAASRSARMWTRTPGSCFRRMRSACNVLFLVHLRQRSYSMLISISVGFTRR
jgi:hypothetical protein